MKSLNLFMQDIKASQKAEKEPTLQCGGPVWVKKLPEESEIAESAKKRS